MPVIRLLTAERDVTPVAGTNATPCTDVSAAVDSVHGSAPLQSIIRPGWLAAVRVRVRPLPDWSYQLATKQLVAAQCPVAVAVLKSPAPLNPTSVSALSLARLMRAAAPPRYACRNKRNEYAPVGVVNPSIAPGGGGAAALTLRLFEPYTQRLAHCRRRENKYQQEYENYHNPTIPVHTVFVVITRLARTGRNVPLGTAANVTAAVSSAKIMAMAQAAAPPL